MKRFLNLKMKLKLFIEELCNGYAWLQAGIYRQPIWRPATVSQGAIEHMRRGGLAVSVCGRIGLIRAQNWAKVMCKHK
jgi:hypothetical protein